MSMGVKNGAKVLSMVQMDSATALYQVGPGPAVVGLVNRVAADLEGIVRRSEILVRITMTWK